MSTPSPDTQDHQRAKDEMQLHLKQLADKLRHEKVVNKQLSARVQLGSAPPIPSYQPDSARGAANPPGGGGGGGGGSGSHSHTMFRSQHPLGSSSVFLPWDPTAHLPMHQPPPQHASAPAPAPSNASLLAPRGTFRMAEASAHKPFF